MNAIVAGVLSESWCTIFDGSEREIAILNGAVPVMWCGWLLYQYVNSCTNQSLVLVFGSVAVTR